MESVSVRRFSLGNFNQESRDPALVRLLQDGWRPVLVTPAFEEREDSGVWEFFVVMAQPTPPPAPKPAPALVVAVAVTLATQVAILVVLLAMASR